VNLQIDDDVLEEAERLAAAKNRSVGRSSGFRGMMESGKVGVAAMLGEQDLVAEGIGEVESMT
jgi:hypothetical protein